MTRSDIAVTQLTLASGVISNGQTRQMGCKFSDRQYSRQRPKGQDLFVRAAFRTIPNGPLTAVANCRLPGAEVWMGLGHAACPDDCRCGDQTARILLYASPIVASDLRTGLQSSRAEAYSRGNEFANIETANEKRPYGLGQTMLNRGRMARVREF